jgi:protein gp37
MSRSKTGIRWTSRTWNPVVGCSKVSAGCRNCYAESLALRYGWTPLPWAERNAELNVTLMPQRLDGPRHWKAPARVFVNSMSDLFHRLVPISYIDQVYDVMADTPRHTYQVLTKRPERQRDYMVDRVGAGMDDAVPGNVWLGTSVEDHRVVDRIEQLKATPAAVRFLSVEPMIGPLGDVDLAGIHWVIVGGESGPKRRPFDHAWARAVRDATLAAGAAFFMKQDAGHRTELRPYLVEADGTRTVWEQYPDDADRSAWIIPEDLDAGDAKALDAIRPQLIEWRAA